MAVDLPRSTLLTLSVILLACVSSFAAGPRWPKGSIVVSVSPGFLENTNNVKPGSDLMAALVRAMARWEAVADLEFKIETTRVTSVSPKGSAGDGISLIALEPSDANLALFTGKLYGSSAVTRVFSDKNGIIQEADIVLNPTFQFSTDGASGTFDLERVFTHELGHFLGLTHSNLPASVMFHEVPVNELIGPNDRGFQLTRDDTVRVRDHYGSPLAEDCCGEVSGVMPKGDGSKGFFILVDGATGAVAASFATDPGVGFDYSGIEFGKYDIWLTMGSETGTGLQDRKLGTFQIEKNRPISIRVDGVPKKSEFSLGRVGKPGSLYDLPIGIKRDRGQRIWVSGKGLRANGMTFGVSSPKIAVTSVRNISGEFSGTIEVFELEIDVAADVPSGSYSIFVQSSSGLRKHRFGVLSVD